MVLSIDGSRDRPPESDSVGSLVLFGEWRTVPLALLLFLAEPPAGDLRLESP